LQPQDTSSKLLVADVWLSSLGLKFHFGVAENDDLFSKAWVLESRLFVSYTASHIVRREFVRLPEYSRLFPGFTLKAEFQRAQSMIGKTFGHYRIASRLGVGGMGEVFLADDIRLERQAAIKFLPAEFAADPERRQRFLKEARAAAALNHPNVCVIYDVGETDDGLPFIAMEFIGGETLDRALEKGQLQVNQIVDLAAQVAAALDAAHTSRIVHRDIKPANISLDKRGQVKVLDFGLAKRLATESTDAMGTTAEMHNTQDGTVVGTPLYMSPEQALGRPLDNRSDCFSLGVVLYELITGQLPFSGRNFAEILNNIVHSQPTAIARLNYNVPPELERITLKCLQKIPDRRYQSARELMIDLRSVARELEYAKDEGGRKKGEKETSSFRLHPSSFRVEPFSLEKLKNCELLLNYASIDDYPLQDGKPGWVSQLHRNLEVRMEQLSGEKVRIALLPENGISPAIEDELMQHIPKANAMISVVSPPFLNSQLCRREVEQFWNGAEQTGGRFVQDKSRLLKVLKTAVSVQQMPLPLLDIFSPLFGFEFFELDADTGRVREFDETFGPVLKQRFFERVYDLAYDGCQVLSLLKHLRAPSQENLRMSPNPHRRYIYLATTTSDVVDERDRIKRELLERGHLVLPEAPLPMVSRDVETMVRDCLAKCFIAIHLLGERYGVTPEDSSESIPALQLRLSADRAFGPGMQRLIWMPRNGECVDARQSAFVRRVQEDPALHHRAEIIEGNLNLLKKDLIRRLTPPEEKSKPISAANPQGGAQKIYLICDSKDESSVEPLEDYLFGHGLEVMLPAFDGGDAEAAALHQDNLLTCDACLIYYGLAPRAWVDIKLRDLLKATGYGRETPIAVQAVYIAGAQDHRKERFHSHQAAVIRQLGMFEPGPELEAFVSRIQEVCK